MSLRNAMSHEVSDLHIIYDTPWGVGPEPHQVCITKRNVPGPDALGAVKLCKLPPPRQKTHKFCRVYCFSLNFYDYVQFRETYPILHHLPVFKSYLMSVKFYKLSTTRVFTS